MESVKLTCAEFVNKFLDKLNKVMKDVAALVEVLKGDIRDLEKEVGLLKWAASNTSRAKDGPSKVKVPKPKAYNGTQNAKELGNFM